MGKSLLISILVMLLPFSLSHASGAQDVSRNYRKANKLFADARYSEALSLYKKVLAAQPDSISEGELYTRIGDSHFQLGQFNNALDAYRSALKTQYSTEQVSTQYWIGFCCFLLGRDDEAVKEFLKIPEHYPEAAMWINTAYYWAGRASERAGKKEQAAAYYKKAGGNGKSTQGQFALKKAESVKGK